MKILSHRGYWKVEAEKNTVLAFDRSFSFGFGTETDVRDKSGRLVISHDIPKQNELDFVEFLSMANSSIAAQKCTLSLALNIKADGLADLVANTTPLFTNLDCFVFDMSIPDMRSYIKAGVPVFTRLSDVEPRAVWIEESAGIWLDGFDSDWYTEATIRELLSIGKRICIVSPELHMRSHAQVWEMLAAFSKEDKLMLCTDYPIEAQKYFSLNRS